MEQREDKTTTTAADGGGGDVWGDDERTRGLEGAAVKRGEGNHTQEKAKQRKEDDGPRAVKVAMDVPLPGRGQCDVNIFLDRVDADNNSGDASDDEREDDNDHHDNEAGSAGQQKEQQGKPVHASADDHHRESLQQTDRPYIRVWSTFDSGNLQAVQAVEVPTRDNDMTLHLEAEVSPDILARASQRELKTWFYFKVTRLDPSRVHTLRVTLTNMTKQLRLYNQGLTPIVYRQHKGQQSGRWGRYCSSVDAELDDDGDFLLSFTYVVDDTHTRDSIVGFAFCYPFSYTECEHMLASYDKRFNHEASAADAGVYFHREVVCKSRDGRSVHLVTITANDDGLSVDQREPRIPPLFPDRNTKRPRVAPDRPVFFVSARVHPGETPASHVCNGIIDFVLNTEDARACALRSMFVFKIIPMLNPDGVARGHYRGDSHGLNLNRFYNNPCPTTHPSIFASKVLTSFYSQQQAGLAFYIDTHGHATKRGCFLYGNCLESARHIDNVTYAKLAELNSPHFDFGCCNFSEKNMFSKDKRDGLSKEGSGRVSEFRQRLAYQPEVDESEVGEYRIAIQMTILMNAPEKERLCT
ncbi:hypothetical protein PTSG_13020 [Salpingoeca rosetta]|uniref:Cytosolic carboxypeptidase-like protein 5 n=1 Tax=Salpingoeca rosetta (strain ATCC 50818 / BSB-021) TaxID=946362 RepID=F2UQW6_SALR5|nr:uncharacterized protein PTSG_13020 [Salpingoeca rosetta]EGD80021.1 hypothetical protein PTSG_13020 [Salpingoeca rosetta]|eukprot:XP_004988346.1 hypothetical protein PTSG_13020 [Salpingoeca rosetta]